MTVSFVDIDGVFFFFFLEIGGRKSRTEGMTFCVSDDSLVMGKSGANTDDDTTHTEEIGHVVESVVGFGVFGSVVWCTHEEHVVCVETQTGGFGVGFTVRKVLTIGTTPFGGQHTRHSISCSREHLEVPTSVRHPSTGHVEDLYICLFPFSAC